ncbi:hypothetical protein OUZ56_002945 [Daphnia magna]|uniref:Uncharacterized protein n=1 Tax=Daphnia magna TaxID=35525 RepID=A0ABR0A793_9CRUS|nr:hypothetical protein OUZ56_002945 [Daphnia magna]
MTTNKFDLHAGFSPDTSPTGSRKASLRTRNGGMMNSRSDKKEEKQSPKSLESFATIVALHPPFKRGPTEL